MNKFDDLKQGYKEISESGKTGKQRFQTICKWAYKLRGMVLAIPVAAAAVILAVRNMVLLPNKVGLVLLDSGEFVRMVDKSIAVFGPLAVTAVCLVLMLCSKRVVYPWLISVFSLLLPVLVLLLNTFPG